jgi:hypothetical protein
MRRVLIALAVAAAIPVVASVSATAKQQPPGKPSSPHRTTLQRELQSVKAATARYHSLKQALRAGYSVAGEPCVASPDGTMGIHAVNDALMADPAIKALRPEILLYVRKANGKLRLVGVEYWKADADGDLTTDADRPSVLGHPFDGPMPGHTPTMPVHYDLHVWIWKTNPSGLFAPFNPALSCTP